MRGGLQPAGTILELYATDPSVSGFKQSWTTSGIGKDGSNFGSYSNPAVDALLSKMVGARSKAELLPACRALERVIAHMHILIPQWTAGTHRIAYNARSYHGDLPTLARSHGPHIDTWYGHSFDGFNVWLSIDGVNADHLSARKQVGQQPQGVNPLGGTMAIDQLPGYGAPGQPPGGMGGMDY